MTVQEMPTGWPIANRLAVPRRLDESGFTLIEVLMALLCLSVISIAATAVTVTLMMQFSNGSGERLAEGTTAQWTSMTFARDVQGATGTTVECAPGEGERLITFRYAGDIPSIEYRVSTDGSTFRLLRVGCSAGDSPYSVVDELSSPPTVVCDGSPCVENTQPRKVRLKISRSAKFSFSLDAVRRTSNEIADPELPPTVAAPFISLGGPKPLTISGSGKLTVLGDAYINNQGTTALALSGSGSLTVGGDLLVQKGSGSGPVLVASGNPRIHVDGNGPAAADMNLCGWCDIKFLGTSPSTATSPVPDPFRFLPAPDTSALAIRTSCQLQSGTYVCQPGVYDGSFPPGGQGDSKFSLEPGNYILRNGFTLQNGRTVQSNGGVLFYLEAGGVTVEGDTKLSVSAPTSGTYAGLLFFQPSSNTSPFNISNGGQVSALGGAIYAPATTAMNLSSGAGTLKIGQVVGQNISITNSGEVIIGGS